MLKRDELLKLAKQSPETLVDYVLALQEQVQNLTRKVNELEARLNKNSNNSSKPPSSDGLKKPKPKNLRKKTGRKTGGQPGHPGKTLHAVDTPDYQIPLVVNSCDCGCCLKDQSILSVESRQVFELPKPKLEVTEFSAETKQCPNCGKITKAVFPDLVTAPVQYGQRFNAFLVYLSQQQLVPLNRVTQLCQELYGAPVSEATITKNTGKCSKNLSDYEAELKTQLLQEPVLHVDESGLRVNAKLHWLHSASTEYLTFYGVHQKRGNTATNAFGILPNFKGTLVHDFWKPYLKYECHHSLCNAHLLRELKFLYEEHNQPWAERLSNLLVEMKNLITSSDNTKEISSRQKNPLLRKYRKIIAEGWKSNPLKNSPNSKPKRGRKPKTKEQNLLDRLENYESSWLAFFYRPIVPFTNNLAERDIRMIKVRQKVSGCFRTLEGAETFARIRSYISTARKNSKNILQSISKALTGNVSLQDITT